MTPGRSLADALRWVSHGTTLFVETVSYDGDSTLPGWSRRHLVAHVAANADALGNLVSWAVTGVPMPMYASPGARTAAIVRGLDMSTGELDSWLRRSATELELSMRSLTPEHWMQPVITAQGRTVPAAEIPWLRARELFVHAVDLGVGRSFTDLPDDFLAALASDVIAKRGGVPDVDGPLAQRVAWLTGRPHTLAGAPTLGPWL